MKYLRFLVRRGFRNLLLPREATNWYLIYSGGTTWGLITLRTQVTQLYGTRGNFSYFVFVNTRDCVTRRNDLVACFGGVDIRGVKRGTDQ